MKKTVFLLFMITSFCLSQNYRSIEVIYNPFIEPSPIESKNIKNIDLVESVNKAISKKSFILKAGKDGFLFTEISILEEDEYQKKISKIASVVYSILDFFYDKKRNQLFSVSNNLNVISNTIYNWELTNESKKIDNYTCYKATCSIEFTTTKGEKVKRLITAWYTPEINFNYGPNGYMGLPGLILELEYDKTKLVAKEIHLFKDDIKIDFPKNKEVTEEEYLKKIAIGQ